MNIPLIPCPTCKGKGKVEDLSKVGPMLRAERITAKVHGTKVARAIGIDKSTLHDMENGIRPAGWTHSRIKAYRAAVKKLSAARKQNGKIEVTGDRAFRSIDLSIPRNKWRKTRKK